VKGCGGKFVELEYWSNLASKANLSSKSLDKPKDVDEKE
jgi:hypothetical protein